MGLNHHTSKSLESSSISNIVFIQRVPSGPKASRQNSHLSEDDVFLLRGDNALLRERRNYH
jgi:hypothetical protein